VCQCSCVCVFVCLCIFVLVQEIDSVEYGLTDIQVWFVCVLV
jgi:hypothetical protein